MDKMVELNVIVGISGSGKTTVANQLCKENEVVLDSDNLRAELLGSSEDQTNNALIFNTMFNRTIENLKNGKNVFYVATNLSSKKRINLIKSVKRIMPNTICNCYIINTPVEVCRERNSMRSRIVPAYVIDKQLRSFEVPYAGEGFDSIKIIDTMPMPANYFENSWKEEQYLIHYQKVYNFGSQNNKHHTKTLFDHCNYARKLAMQYKYEDHIIIAASIHDFGKAYTATSWPEKDNDLHFPNHANISGYLALNMGYSLEIAQLVCYHMVPFMDKHAQNIWRSRLGDKLWNDIMLLHKVDEEAK